MYKIFLFIATLFIFTNAHAQKNKFDTTVKIGKNGFRILCSNKSATKNTLRISPIGFEEVLDEINIDIKGKVYGAEIDDLNKDGFNDLVVYIVLDDKKNKGTVIAIASDENKRIMPITFPEVVSNEKLKNGYDGNDSFKLLNGTLTHRFAVIDTTQNTEQIIIARQVLYTVIKGEYGNWKFKVQRIVDIFKQ
jgi:hypothetical protein